jgi:hypothetical protein
LDAELSFPATTKDSFLSSAGYYRDGEDPNAVTGHGFLARKKLFEKSNEVELMHKLSVDLFNQDLLMISNVEIDITISPSSDDFMILTDAAAKKFSVEILACKLYVKSLDLMVKYRVQIIN